MSFWTAFFLALLVIACAAVWYGGGHRIKGAAVAVAAVWVVAFAYSALTGDFDNWRFLFAVDVIAAAWVLTPPCSEARKVIGILYVGQIIFHGVYGSYELRGLEGPRDAYLLGLYWLGLAQLAALMAGAFHDWSRKRDYGGGMGRRGAIPVAAADARERGAR